MGHWEWLKLSSGTSCAASSPSAAKNCAASSSSSANSCLLEHLEHMGREEHGRTWCMDAAQLDTQRKKEEAILKTSSTTYSTNRSSSSTRPAKLQLDRAEKSKSNP
ncbi:unnamed protein product [Microthlaspi erraticum]|uniref:Uncharacterized protein n=1 Tax=Microthlaspi erraticum TaxID=1685480 RepID=A0A6D2JEU4_9BRAS|nr:unnamed protein product [Microthlaspi erraticum]